jgi:hypothetical protein
MYFSLIQQKNNIMQAKLDQLEGYIHTSKALLIIVIYISLNKKIVIPRRFDHILKNKL